MRPFGKIRSSAQLSSPAFIIPLASGLLALPFTGLRTAAGIACAAGFLGLLGKLVRSALFARSMSAGAGAAARVREHAAVVPHFIHSNAAAFGVVSVLLLVVLPLSLNDYYQDIMTLTGMYILLALGLNIIVGQAGLLNLGYVAFYAIGAYTYAILSTKFGVSFWPGLLAGASVSAMVAALLGMPILKLRGDYFAIVTLGLGEITRIVLNNWDGMTGGPNGISRIPRPSIAGYQLHTTLDFYYLVLFFVLITIFAMKRLIDSRIGRAWIAIREDETAAEAMGIDTFRLKLLAFVLGSLWAGIAGVLFAAKMAFVSPESFTFFESVLILCMVVLGGMGNIAGIIMGVFLLVTLPEIFRDFQDYRMLAFGAALILMMIFRPQGLLGSGRRERT